MCLDCIAILHRLVFSVFGFRKGADEPLPLLSTVTCILSVINHTSLALLDWIRPATLAHLSFPTIPFTVHSTISFDH